MLVALVAACLPARMAAAISAEISGYVEGTFNKNLNDPPAWPPPPPAPPEPSADTPLHLYDADVNTFLLNSAHVAIAGILSDQANYVVELDFGYDAFINSAASVGFPYYADLQEAYVEASSTTSRLGLRAGKFATYQGIEKIEAPDNPTISRGLLFTYAQPRTHTGAVVTYNVEEVQLALGLVNGWDMLVDDNDDQTFLANVQMTPMSDLDLKITYMKGNEEIPAGTYERSSIDVVAKLKLEYDTTLYLQYNKGTQVTAGADEDWSGWGVQLVYEPSADVTVGFRYESFEDEDNVRVGAGLVPPAFAFPAGTGVGTYENITFSLGFQLSGSTMLRFEVRMDEADWDAFMDDDGLATDRQTTLGLEFYCRF